MPKSYAAFLSYSHRYADWVEILHTNLEACLAHAGETRKVFLDKVDLGTGRSWVGQLQAGLDQADHLVLVVTPEALASPRVEDEWGNFIAMHRGWKGRLQVVMLVDTPLPPFLTAIQYVDFRDPGESNYRKALRELLSGLLGQPDRRTLPALTSDIAIPGPLPDLLPTAIRRQLVAWLESILERKGNRIIVAFALDLQASELASHPSLACAASTAIVQATGDDHPATAALRIVKALGDAFEEETELLGGLTPLREQLEDAVRDRATDGLLGVWLRSVERDHATLVPYFEQGAGPALLGRVYVQLELRADRRRAALPEAEPLALARARALDELLALDPGEHSWVTRRWVVLGDPGAGKTTLLRYLAWSLARAPQPRWVPLYESWPRLMRDREWLLDRIARQLRHAGHPARGLPAVLDREAQEGRLLLLLDGLDEIPREDRDEAESLLRDFAARWPRSPIVVTSRPIGYRRPAHDFLELDLLPLDRERQREFLGRWFGRREGEP
ncbi:MAG: TIR domain-containing protein, partial [bacterium]|nr:TIR domain-containing protein [bacterium]